MKRLLVVMCLWSAVPAFAVEPPLSPEVQDALKRLKSEQFKVREQAERDLQKAIGEGLIAVTQQLKGATLEDALEFNGAISRWAMSALQAPAAEREKQLAWGLDAKNLPMLGKLYSTRVKDRIAGVRELAKGNDEQSLLLLARMLDDPERAVYLAAMEEVEKKPATDAAVDALWSRAIEAPLGNMGFRAGAGRQVVFRGMNLGMAWDVGVSNNRMQDANFAGDVLVTLKPPQVRERLVQLYERAAQAYTDEGVGGRMGVSWQMLPSSPSMRNAGRLVEALKPREVLPHLMALIESKHPNLGGQTVNRGNNAKPIYLTQRAIFMAQAAVVLGGKPQDYLMENNAQYGTSWVFADADAEKKAVAMLKAAVEKQQAASRPAEQK